MKTSKKSGFTLIELLVVVAIIAVIGAGVAVTYNRLDERAKVAMEMNDIGVLEKTISHWSFLHDGNLPNRLDSLIETDGSTLYSAMTGANGYGLSMQAGFTFEAVKAPEYVLNQLSVAGIDTVYMHYNNASPANDSTYTNDTTAAKKMDVSGTIATLDADADSVADNLAQMQAIVDQQDALREAMANGQDYTVSYTLPSTGETATRTFPARMASMIAMIINSAQETVDSAGGNLLDTLAFIWPEGGTQMGMNLANEIIVNAGLNPDLVADPNDDVEAARNAGKAYWLVVFGLGRFCDLYTGNGARLLEPVSGKRYTDDQYYNRYLMVVKVPVYGYDSMTGQGNQKASVAAILSPNGLGRSRLDSTYQDAVKATSN